MRIDLACWCWCWGAAVPGACLLANPGSRSIDSTHQPSSDVHGSQRPALGGAPAHVHAPEPDLAPLSFPALLVHFQSAFLLVYMRVQAINVDVQRW